MTMTSRMIETRNSIDASTREKLVELCNGVLADAVDLATQCKQAHWNVRGSNFIAIHELFDTVTDEVREHADQIAERAAQLGGIVNGTARDAAGGSSLPEYPHDILSDKEHASAVATALAAFAERTRNAIDQAAELGDAPLEDIFTEVVRSIDKHTWFVEAHTQA